MSNRDLFSESSSALVEAKEHSEGKVTLKTHIHSNRVKLMAMWEQTIAGIT